MYRKKSIQNYYDALFRLENNLGQIIPPNSKINLDNVAREAGNNPTSIRRDRLEQKQLIIDIEAAEQRRINNLSQKNSTPLKQNTDLKAEIKILKEENQSLKINLQESDNKLYSVVRENFLLRAKVLELENLLDNNKLIRFPK